MDLVLPYDIINNTPADAVPVEANYNVIAEFVNSQVINRDGGVAMVAPLLLAGDPTATNHAANKGYVDALLPVGVMMPFGGVSAPAGQWLLCDGSAKSTTTYPLLYNVLGYRFGGSGGTFNVPDMRGRFPIGVDTAQTEFSATGKKGGTFTVPVPAHVHAMPHTHPMPHTHEMPHTHPINPPSTLTTAAGSHAHTFAAINLAANISNGNIARGAGGTNTTFPTDTEPAHQHSVDIAQFDSGQPDDATTDASSAANTGAVSTPNTASTGTAAVEMQPPYTVVNYIIRAA